VLRLVVRPVEEPGGPNDVPPALSSEYACCTGQVNVPPQAVLTWNVATNVFPGWILTPRT
jgi:hypothetical protein